jgi:hypothetical protein
MKKKNIILASIVLALIFSVGAIVIATPRNSKSSEVKDLSNITLPSHDLPKGYLTKEKAIEDAVNLSKRYLSHGQMPQNPQCILITYGEYAKLFETGFASLEIPNDKLFYLVTVDVDRELEERESAAPSAERSTHKEQFITHQDFYLIDPENGDVIGFGGNVVKWILPKQR